MPRFFVEADQVQGGRVRIIGDDARHLLRSLRVRPGETLIVVEAGAMEHGVVVDSLEADSVEGAIAWSREARGEPSLQVHVLLAMAAQNMDAAVELLTVCGAASIQPVLTHRAVVRDPAAGRVRRLRTVALNAAQLAGRGRVPAVADPLQLEAALDALPPACRILAAVIDENAAPVSGLAVAAPEVAMVIGPEGGLSPQEISTLCSRGAELVHLGPRTLPHHAAGAVAVSLLLAAHGDLASAVQR